MLIESFPSVPARIFRERWSMMELFFFSTSSTSISPPPILSSSSSYFLFIIEYVFVVEKPSSGWTGGCFNRQVDEGFQTVLCLLLNLLLLLLLLSPRKGWKVILKTGGELRHWSASKWIPEKEKILLFLQLGNITIQSTLIRCYPLARARPPINSRWWRFHQFPLNSSFRLIKAQNDRINHRAAISSKGLHFIFLSSHFPFLSLFLSLSLSLSLFQTKNHFGQICIRSQAKDQDKMQVRRGRRRGKEEEGGNQIDLCVYNWKRETV